jgi:hypothetical protein
LTDQTPTSGAQGHADRDFLAAGGGAREEQVRNIGARDEKYESHDGHQKDASEQEALTLIGGDRCFGEGLQ